MQPYPTFRMSFRSFHKAYPNGELFLNKTYVRDINIDDDSVCYTEDFLIVHGNLINTTIGGRTVVIVNDPGYGSISAWYNDSGQPIGGTISFFRESDLGRLKRVEMLKPGIFWHVWVEFFRDTDINRSNTFEFPTERSGCTSPDEL